MKLGRIPSKPDPRTLQLAHYIDRTILPQPPPVANWNNSVWKWPMYANDVKGDCVIAALAHQWNCWTKYATGTEGGPTEAEVLAIYGKLSPDDNGVSMLEALRYFRKQSFSGTTLDAFAALNVSDRFEIETAISLFGGVFLGLALPNALVEADDMAAMRWVIPADAHHDMSMWAPNPDNGHAVISVAYFQSQNYLDAVTWGQTRGMSWQWNNTYVDEAYVLVSKQWLKATGKTPSGINFEQMMLDVAAITAHPQEKS